MKTESYTSAPRQIHQHLGRIVKNIMVVTSASCGPGVLAVVERVHAKLAPVAEDSRNLEVH